MFRGSDYCISIHAPVRGATLSTQRERQSTCISIHAPVRGATNQNSVLQILIAISIHAPVRGATQLSSLQSGLLNFNPRSREGSDSNFNQFFLFFFIHFYHFLYFTSNFFSVFQKYNLFLTVISSFFWCESPRYFLSTSHSHHF